MKVLSKTADAAASLGRFLRNEMDLSRHQIASLKPQNGIFVNGTPQHTNYYLSPGDVVEVRLSDEPACVEPFEGPINVVYEDGDILVIDKPAPLPTQSSSLQSADTLENRMAFHYPHLPFRPVNRLDKGTSGLLTCAKHAHAQYRLSRLLHTDSFLREYLAVVSGVPSPASGRIDAPIRKVDAASVRREVRADGLPSATRYETKETKGGLSLVRLRLETGRTHQIRVHMAHIGCPVFGDFLYGRESPLLPGRFALHSHFLRLVHPFTGAEMEFVSPLPPDIEEIFRT